jgi:hypothetical protein
MGVVIAPSNRLELGAFLAQRGATCLRIPLQRVPVKSTGWPSMRRVRRVAGNLESFIAEVQISLQTHASFQDVGGEAE